VKSFDGQCLSLQTHFRESYSGQSATAGEPGSVSAVARCRKTPEDGKSGSHAMIAGFSSGLSTFGAYSIYFTAVFSDCGLLLL
jgi:hypothetical protein